MFHGTLCASAQEEKNPLTTAAGHPVVPGREEEGHGAAEREADHPDARRVDQGMADEHVEATSEVPEVLGERAEPGHGGVHQIDVTGVDAGRVPVGAFAEAPQVRREHDVPATGQLVGVVAVRGVGRLEPDRLRLPGTVTVTREDRRARRCTVIRYEEVRGHRHRVLGVEDDLVPAVAVALLLVEGLEVEGHRLGERTEEVGQSPAAARSPFRQAREVVDRDRIN